MINITDVPCLWIFIIIYIEIFIHISIHIVRNLNPYLGYKVVVIMLLLCCYIADKRTRFHTAGTTLLAVAALTHTYK